MRLPYLTIPRYQHPQTLGTTSSLSCPLALNPSSSISSHREYVRVPPQQSHLAQDGGHEDHETAQHLSIQHSHTGLHMESTDNAFCVIFYFGLGNDEDEWGHKDGR